MIVRVHTTTSATSRSHRHASAHTLQAAVQARHASILELTRLMDGVDVSVRPPGGLRVLVGRWDSKHLHPRDAPRNR